MYPGHGGVSARTRGGKLTARLECNRPGMTRQKRTQEKQAKSLLSLLRNLTLNVDPIIVSLRKDVLFQKPQNEHFIKSLGLLSLTRSVK